MTNKQFVNLTDDEMDQLASALAWLGEKATLRNIRELEICEDGSVYLGLTQVCPNGTINYCEDSLAEGKSK